MSKYKVIDPQFKNETVFREALRFACEELSIEFKSAPGNHLHLIGYRGDTRPEKVKYVVRRECIGTASNDLGFTVDEDGNVKVIISEYDSNGAGKQAMKILERVKQEYALQDLRVRVRAQGHQIESVVRKQDGSYRVKVRV